MIFFAEVKVITFLISSRATFQSLVDEPTKLFLEIVEEPNSIKSPLVMLLVPIPSSFLIFVLLSVDTFHISVNFC